MKINNSSKKAGFIACLLLVTVSFNASAQNGNAAAKSKQTFCNPLNLPYNFQPGGITRREAADPVIVLYKHLYWLFCSKQVGYWFSPDLTNWTLVKPEGLPLDVYAPSVAVVNGKLYYTSGGNKGTFTTDDPAGGKWTNINTYPPGCADPALFQDTDGKIYLYDGCSDKTPLTVTELNTKTLLPAGPKTAVVYADTAKHGWEIPGDYNRGNGSSSNAAPWIEGSFINKFNGKYYLQYSAPGTQFKTYGDGVYVADRPTGPFVYQDYSPFSFKPTGFITGAGHSSTFSDKSGLLWHISTGTISVRQMFERRLVLFPTEVLTDGQLVTNTYLGDYPQYVPGSAKGHLLGNSPQWMLLSLGKKATASSILPTESGSNFSVKNAFDENIRTWWSAATGNPGEWLRVDLGKICRINAIQTNFADQGAVASSSLVNDGYQYFIETSDDDRKWHVIIDHRKHGKDAPHDYVQLDKPVIARYVRITNAHSPAKGLFSISDFRVFGSGMGTLPSQVNNLSVKRDADQRRAKISWAATPNTEFYIVRYGIKSDRLFGNYQVYNANSLDVNSLNAGVKYYFTVDAVNSTGITKGKAPAKNAVY
jgi:xylan 1,4-beta-xylosidase